MYLFNIIYTYIKKGTNAGIDANKAKQSPTVGKSTSWNSPYENPFGRVSKSQI